jgi:sugar lactone lactonase YvrE
VLIVLSLSRRVRYLVILFLVAGFCAGAVAQNAPSLLPYTVKLLAGGGAAIKAGATCPVSGLTATDAFGDGCLATEISIATSGTGTGPRYAVADKTGAVFFSDATNGLVRRIDPITGEVTAVAGGATSNPGSGTTCGTLTSTDVDGDGCLGTAVKLSHPMGLAFDAAGNLYFADNGFDDVRKVAATNGVIATTGVISNIAGNLSTFGYNVNNTASSPVNAATQSYLNFPYGIAIDGTGNLYIADEGNNALEVVNLTASSEIIQGMTVPAGTIAKFAGYGSLAAKSATSGDCPDFVSTTARGGCYFGNFSNGTNANTSNVDSAYNLAVDAAGNVYFANEFNDNVGLITKANVISTYAGIQGTAAKQNVRGAAGSFAIGSVFGVAADANANLYVTDASGGYIWRVDAATGHAMYVVAGGASSVCATAIDIYGDGCLALQAKLGSSGTGNFASTAAPGPGVFGVAVDAYSDLFVGDTETGLIREIASGSQFGNVGATQTDVVQIHFVANDSPASSGAYSITAGGGIFTLGSATCTVNSDSTEDCLLPITATPTALGAFTGTLQVKAQLGGTATFPLSGNFVQSPVTRTVISASNGTSCTGSSTYSTAAPATLTATLVANGPSAPHGSIIFYANGTALAPTTGVTVTNLGTTSAPVYGATLAYTFTTAGTYAITASYSGDTYFKASTSTAAAPVTAALPAFATAATSYQSSAVTAGQTALYSFNVVQTVYSGTITFACSGLPANSSCSFTTNSITATGCSTTTTVGLSILTQHKATVVQSAIGSGGRSPWTLLSALSGVGLALLIGLAHRRTSRPLGQVLMALALLAAVSEVVACSSSVKATSSTPAGTYTVMVTATGSTGSTSSFTVPLTVN